MTEQTPPSTETPTPEKNYGKGYGKRPLWQWILIYVVIGAIVYAGVYYFVFAKKGNNTYNYSANTSSGETQVSNKY